MILSDIGFTRRENGHHHYRGYTIEAVRIGSGYGILVTFRPSQIDLDFQKALHSQEIGVWSPSQDELEKIQWYLDESDFRTAKLLKRDQWEGRRPFRLHDFM